ncbi:hypothetical protein HUN59_16220 [Curtobacterium sp. Csp2]|uniref:hypothetical protein n=1 Tax=Curtobacterium sp. Csp2 TaxID=2495430 RepID=UPI00157FE968|nr:hypothetical protein [Curtobacterium sp. Csp2]QKS17548.1 hypothetical protein HUN59_16220 [Curtobacterium sp. Csp2]
MVIGFGWGVAGPVRVAHASAAGQRSEYVQSLIIRVALAVLVCPVAALAAFAVTGTWSWTVALAVTAVALVGCGPTWFFVGRGKPFASLLLDTVPRVAGTVGAITLAAQGSSVIAIFIAQLAGIIVGLIASTIYVLRMTGHHETVRTSRQQLVHSVWTQTPGMVSALVATLYTTLPITIVAAFAPSALPVYALVDKLQKQVSSSISPVIQILQGYVARASEGQRGARLRRSFLGVASLSLTGAVLFSFVGTDILRWLSSGQIAIGAIAVILLGSTFGIILFEQFLSRAVIPRLDMLKRLPIATIAGAIVGLILVMILVMSSGAVGALLGVAIGLAVTVVLELLIVWRGARQ